jgi:hypothetical protein
MPANNYFWGYLRNELNWAVASYYENPMADTFLNDALVTRWQNAFVPYANSDGKGGTPGEGSQYGRYLLEYPTVPFTTAGLLGRDLYAETNFYREALYNLIYATSIGPVANEAGTSSFHQIFPYSDDFESHGYPPAADPYYGDFVTSVATHYNNTALEGYARQWLATTGAPASRYVQAVDDGGAATPLSSLPLDYYAPGMQNFYGRRSWADGATNFVLQMGEPVDVGHSHMEAGSFQLVSGGRWLTKATSGYNGNVVGWGGIGTAPINSTIPNNGLLFNGQGLVSYEYNDAAPAVTRLESRPDYAFASVDLSGAYRAHVRPQVDNPYASNAVRDFVYVRALDALIVLDRMESTSADVTKTFLLHFPTAPTLSGNTALGVNGNMALRLTTLTPAGQSPTTLRVVDERPASQDNSIDYQWRVEADTRGSAQSYLVNVMQARGVNDPDLTISMTEEADAFVITLTHPTRGTAVIRLPKGMKSAGGSFGYSPSAGATPAAQALTGAVQQISVTDAGPVWEGTGPSNPPPPPAPTLSFSQATYSAGEGAGAATVTVTRGGDTTVPVTVNYATSNGSATAGADYTGASGTLSFAAGETSKTFAVTLLDDSAVEGSETINLTLSAPSGGGAALGRALATLTITDNDVAQPPPDTTAPVISGVTTSGVGQGGATIGWTTNEPADTLVEYGTTAAYGSRTALNAAMVTGHTAGLTGLLAGTTYHYRVLSRDAAGNLATSQDFAFTTTAAPPPPPPQDPNPTVFSPVAGLGDFTNYTALTPSRWSVAADAAGEKRLVLGADFPERGEDLVGEYALLGGAGRVYGDFDFTMQARSNENLSANGSADYVVVFGYQGPGDYSYLMLNGKAANTRFFRVAGGVATAYAASAERGVFDNNWHALRLTRSGQTLTATIDGRQVLSTTDAGLAAAGALGVGSYNDTASFDDISVIVPARTPVPSLATTTAGDAPGTQRLFTATYSDDNGVDDLNFVYLRLNAYLPVMLDAVYSVPANKLYLRGADGSTLLGGFAPGSANVITAANGTLDCSKVTVSRSGTGLTVNWSLAAAGGLAGDNQLFVRAVDRGGRDSGYVQPAGACWTITGNQAPTDGPVAAPAEPAAAGAYATFTSSYSDPNGATNLKFVYLVLNADDAARRLELIYVPEQNRLFVRGDNGLSLLGGCAPGAAMVISNSRGSLDCAATTVTRTGDTITVNWRVAATSALAGDNTVWTRAYDHGGLDTLYKKQPGVIWTVLPA